VGWRLLILGVIAFFALKIINILSHVIIPLTIALLLSALLAPFVGLLIRARLPGRSRRRSWCSSASPRSSASSPR